MNKPGEFDRLWVDAGFTSKDMVYTFELVKRFGCS
ncbi:hypothetical protein DYBT9275_03108 [Dyadobacter sp. CECT 9275]|uniref:Uncharacterized protein n=1 Tax=Dyadobacter helix TaxID=2822344 RepID=A0A916JDV7_9BACT|nr:hypothetical protein DYBT9275_03108 [Dyadobacter sp. CECT 9275]